MAANTLSQFPSPDPARQANEDMMRTIARRIATTEPRARTYTTAVLLSALARPRQISPRARDQLPLFR